MFFITYVVFQPPATVLIRKMGPSYFLSLMILCWGALMMVSLRLLLLCAASYLYLS